MAQSLSDLWPAVLFVLGCITIWAAIVHRKPLNSWFHWLFTAHQRQYADKSEVERCIVFCKHDSEAMETIQAQIAKVAASTLTLQRELDAVKPISQHIPVIMSHLETHSNLFNELSTQITDLKGEIDGKRRPNPKIKPRNWSAFRAAAEEGATSAIGPL